MTTAGKIDLAVRTVRRFPKEAPEEFCTLEPVISGVGERELNVLCTSLANSAVVYADETSWSIQRVWAFLSEKTRLLCNKIMRLMLDRQLFVFVTAAAVTCPNWET